MNILDPQYGKSILERHFEDITYRDYEEVNKTFPTDHTGIYLLFYDGYFSGHIAYKNDSVLFKLESEYDKYISIKFSNKDLTSAHFEYFSDVIGKLQSNKKEINSICRDFKVQLPINYIRQEKLNQLV
jgi:hypothetical protein